MKKFASLVLFVFVAAVLVACGDDDSGDFATRPSGDSSSSVAPKSSSSSEKEKSSSSVVPSSSSAESSSSSSVPEGYVDPSTVVTGTMTDERDGQTYKTVTIGTQTWMAENLNYAYTGVPFHYTLDDRSYTSDSTSWCYKDSVEYCAKYGRLYTWAAAMDSVGEWSANGKGCGNGNKCSRKYPVRGVCPEGWHLPTETECNTLITAVGGSSTAGSKLKSTSGWTSNGNSTDAFGFSALPAGLRYYNGGYDREGYGANFLSSTEFNSYNANLMHLNYDDVSVSANLPFNNKNFGYSVRCVKDEQAE